MKKAARGLSLAAVIVSCVSLVIAIAHILCAQSSRWMAVGILVFALGMLPVSLVLRCNLRKEKHFRWIGVICGAVIAGLFFVGDTLAEVLLKNQVSPTVENPGWVDMIMVYSFLIAFASFGLTLTASLLDAVHSLGDSRQDKNPLRLSTKVFWSDIIVGILWSISGIAAFGKHNSFAFLVCKICLTGACAVTLIMHRIRSDRFDEMAQANYNQAKSKTLDIMCIILMGGYTVLVLLEGLFDDIPAALSLSTILSSDYARNMLLFFIGLQSIIKGLIFRKLEAA